jgi:hypothetical protein
MTFSICDIPEEVWQQNKLQAIEWYKQGKKPTFSQGICELTTAGYGRCDESGYFEYSLPVDQKTNRIDLE